MGLRGVWAGQRREALERLEERGDEGGPLPWQLPGQSRLEKVEKFLTYLPITKGVLAGKKMKLLPEQKKFIKAIYGRKHSPRIGILSLSRGNGKTGLIAGLELCHLLGPEAELRGECYSAAIDRQQAGIIFSEMEAIIMAVEEFCCRVNIQRFHKRIEILDGEGISPSTEGKGSTYEALSADARRAHGLAPSLWVYDELAQAKDRVLLDNLQTAMGKRKRSLGLIISTQAPDDDHPLSQLIDDGINGGDKSVVVQVLSAPVDADPFDTETIEAVNPAFGKFLNKEEVLSEAQRAKRIPAFEPAFRNLRLNQRVDAAGDERLCTARVWNPLGETKVDRAALKGRKCFAALDLSAKHDLTALTLAFPDDGEDENGVAFDLLNFFWTPQAQLAERRPSEQDRFKEWIKAGHIITIPGPTVRFSYVARQLIELSQEFEIEALGYDRWRIDDFQQDLKEIDENFSVPLVPIGQGFKDMAPAIQWFVELADTGRIRHGDNPVLNACVANAVVVMSPAGDHKIDKDKSRNKGPVRIDGAVTMVMALELAKRMQVRKPTYEMMVF